jgi:hypothetical protein
MRNLQLRFCLSLAVLLLATGSALAQVDFTRYVALGDSLTAGVVSYGSVEKYQKNSIPAILARQAGVATFQQPLVNEPGLPPLLELKSLNVTSQGIVPVIAMKSGAGSPTNATYQGVYNNLGIDGANTGDLLTRTGNIYNLGDDMLKLAAGTVQKVVPFSDLVLRDGQHTAIQLAIAANPTFMTVWIGNNDILGAAQTALFMDGVTVTPLPVFKQNYETLLGTLKTNLPNTKILVATIPNVSAIPFVTTVKPYLINPTNGSHVPLIGENGPLAETDYVTLMASSLIAQGIGVPTTFPGGGTGLPLPEGKVDATGFHAGVILRSAEVATIEARTAEMNAFIKQTASSVGAKVVDTGAFFTDLKAHGMVVGGIKLSTAFLTGGLFSYDGMHGQQISYGILANEFVKAINSGFGATLPEVDMLPLLTGGQSATSVAAATFVFSAEAGISMIKGSFPDADCSGLMPHHAVRRHVGPTPEHGPKSGRE